MYLVDKTWTQGHTIAADGRGGRSSSRCQGEGRGFESRLPLQREPPAEQGVLIFQALAGHDFGALAGRRGDVVALGFVSSSGGGSPECFEWQCSYFAAEWRGFGHAGEYVACVESIAEAFSEEAKPARVAR